MSWVRIRRLGVRIPSGAHLKSLRCNAFGPFGFGDTQVHPYMDPYMPVGMAPLAVGAQRLA